MVKTMTIATIDIGGTGIKFASLTPDGKILDKTSIPTPESLEDLLAWLDQRLSEQDYSGIATVSYTHLYQAERLPLSSSPG